MDNSAKKVVQWGRTFVEDVESLMCSRQVGTNGKERTDMRKRRSRMIVALALAAAMVCSGALSAVAPTEAFAAEDSAAAAANQDGKAKGITEITAEQRDSASLAINVHWVSVLYVPGQVYRSVDGGAWESVFEISGGVTSFTDRDVQAGHSYKYKVVATDGSESIESAEVKVEANLPTANLRYVGESGTGKVKIEIASTNAYDTNVYRSTDQKEWKKIGVIKKSEDTYEDVFLKGEKWILDQGKTYYYMVRTVDESGSEGADSDVKSFEIPTLSDSGYAAEPPEFVTVSATAGLAQASVYFHYSCEDNSKIEILVNGKVVKTIKTDYKYNDTKTVTVAIPYGKKAKIQLRGTTTKLGKSYTSKSKVISVSSLKLEKSTISVTKINDKTAGISTNKVSGASYYLYYRNGKQIGKSKKSYFKYTKGSSGKFKVVAVYQKGSVKKTNKGASGSAKANEIVFYKGRPGTGEWNKSCRFSVQKISLSGSTYTVTGYAVNRRYITCKEWDSLKIDVKADGKVVASKTYKHYTLNLKGEGQKQLTFKIQGKSGVDLRNLGGYNTYADPEWI